jgi:hypothetical protein
MEKIIFASIGWHPTYDGTNKRAFVTGANWKGRENGDIGELENFKSYKGKNYIYILPNRWRINLSKFGAKSDASYLDGFTIVFVAPDRRKSSQGRKIIGWCTDARVYSTMQKRPKPLSSDYIVEAKCSNATLLPEADRNFIFTGRFRNIWYADKLEDRNFVRKVLRYITP